MEVNHIDPITRLLNMKIIKYQICDYTFFEEDIQPHLINEEDSNDLDKFILPDLKKRILRYQITNLNHHFIDLDCFSPNITLSLSC